MDFGDWRRRDLYTFVDLENDEWPILRPSVGFTSLGSEPPGRPFLRILSASCPLFSPVNGKHDYTRQSDLHGFSTFIYIERNETKQPKHSKVPNACYIVFLRSKSIDYLKLKLTTTLISILLTPPSIRLIEIKKYFKHNISHSTFP